MYLHSNCWDKKRWLKKRIAEIKTESERSTKTWSEYKALKGREGETSAEVIGPII